MVSADAIEARIHLPVEEPGSRIVSREPNGDIVAVPTNVDDISPDRIRVVVGAAAGTSNDAERMSVKMERVLAVKQSVSATSKSASSTYRSSSRESRD